MRGNRRLLVRHLGQTGKLEASQTEHFGGVASRDSLIGTELERGLLFDRTNGFALRALTGGTVRYFEFDLQ